ncbi:MAG: ABC transporter substrate-binding protein [Chromatiales bacterium]|jgi:NitT/TauT family transport system substrate-binding protein
MNRRRFLQYLGLTAVATGSPGFVGCGKAPTLNVTIHPWVGYETLYHARDFNWLPTRIQLNDYSILGESLAALQSGEADAACLTLDEMLRSRASGIPLSAALVFNVSAGADMVIARPEIEALADLADKRIGYDPDSVGALVFAKLLDAAELPPSAVTQVNLPPAKQLDAWRRGEVDAVVTYEPIASALTYEGARNLFDSRQMPDTIIDVLAVRRDHQEILPLLRDLVSIHFRALDYIRGNEEDAVQRISARNEISPREVRQALAGITLPTLAANRGYLLGKEPGLVRAAKALSRLMVRYGLLTQEDDLRNLVLPDALPQNGP